MAMQMFTLVIVVTTVALLIRTVVARYQFQKKYKLPPSVPGWPLIGNSLDVPFPAGMWTYKMAQRYGEMYDRSTYMYSWFVTAYCWLSSAGSHAISAEKRSSF